MQDSIFNVHNPLHCVTNVNILSSIQYFFYILHCWLILGDMLISVKTLFSGVSLLLASCSLITICVWLHCSNNIALESTDTWCVITHRRSYNTREGYCADQSGRHPLWNTGAEWVPQWQTQALFVRGTATASFLCLKGEGLTACLSLRQKTWWELLLLELQVSYVPHQQYMSSWFQK